MCVGTEIVGEYGKTMESFFGKRYADQYCVVEDTGKVRNERLK
jgi:hypothetical protein